MKLKKLKIIEELHYSGMTSEGTEYLCIEQLSSNQYLLDIRHRETIGDLENWREDYLNKLKKNDPDEWQKLYESYEGFDLLWQDIEMPKEVNGKKVVEIQDGEFFLGEKLECYGGDTIKFSKFDEEVMKFLNYLKDESMYKGSGWDIDRLAKEIEEYTSN